MIDLGLARIGRLIKHTPQTWKAIHVAGTNGKGSICAYISAMLNAKGISCARFTSPHLVDRWDCIAINGKPVSETLFLEVEKQVKQRDETENIGASEFELLTATAFEIFNHQKVEYGVVEVGLGGRLDATNTLKEKTVTVISKIGLDHQSFLGNTIEEIALQKAGIIRQGVPCVVDGSNQKSVLEVIQQHAQETGSPVHFPDTKAVAEELANSGETYEPHQIQNLATAHLAFRLACPEHDEPLTSLLPAIKQLKWPGRLQKISLENITGRQQEVLLDGAHNTQSAEALAGYVQKHLRSSKQPITWVLAATEGKDMNGILGLLLQPGDQVVAVRFEPVDGMPWVKAADPNELLNLASQHGVDKSAVYSAGENVKDALLKASEMAGERPVVIAGSLYLVSSPTISPVNISHLTPTTMTHPNHLIIVCGHGIYLGGPKNGQDEENEWLIEPYKKGETPTFIEHIKAGCDIFNSDPESVLVFSGGPTRPETPLTEARSYFNLAIDNNFLIPPSLLDSRVLVEDRALDSYFNILFSLVLYWRHHPQHHWPKQMTIVSHGFKRDRIVNGHCAAIGFPLERVDYLGIDPPGLKREDEGSNQLTLGLWEQDPHGAGEELMKKRSGRNCWGFNQQLFLDKDEEVEAGMEGQVRVLEDWSETLVDCETGTRPWAR
ncbi:Mur ligase [Triangularia verruculosa]|uniref:dihydrofolate synthase n=1 Tax=Triangularia verruculosa TaxID=2587418 RepID=A0AAN6XMV9_9PEZI|nr:Mur ligase [Triangularia verruculosa]